MIISYDKLIIPVFLVFCTGLAQSDRHIDFDWIEPDAWGIADSIRSQRFENDVIDSNGNRLHTNNGQQECSDLRGNSRKISREIDISAIYYKKLVLFLFNRNKLKYDEATNLYRSAFIFEITPKELSILEASNDPRDWDGVVEDILLRATVPNDYKVTWWSQIRNFFTSFMPSFDFARKLFGFETSSETRFTLFVISLVLTSALLSRVFNIGIIVVIFMGIFISGFLTTYYDCNKNLEIEQIISYTERKSSGCDYNDLREENILSSFMQALNPFGKKKPSRQECLEHLKRKHKVKSEYCRPDDVFLTYINEIILKQYFLIIERSTNMFEKLITQIRFPYNIISLIIFGMTLTIFLKSIIKYIYSPLAWAHLINNRNFTRQNDDSVSADNLRSIIKEEIKGIKPPEATISYPNDIRIRSMKLEFKNPEEKKTIASNDSNDHERNKARKKSKSTINDKLQSYLSNFPGEERNETNNKNRDLKEKENKETRELTVEITKRKISQSLEEEILKLPNQTEGRNNTESPQKTKLDESGVESILLKDSSDARDELKLDFSSDIEILESFSDENSYSFID